MQPITQVTENPVTDYIVDTALAKVEKITEDLEQCFEHLMTTLKAAEVTMASFNAITDRLANDAFSLSGAVTSFSLDANKRDGSLEAGSTSVSSIEFGVLMNEIAELRAQLASLERNKS